jgi:hypothetical protein
MVVRSFLRPNQPSRAVYKFLSKQSKRDRFLDNPDFLQARASCTLPRRLHVGQ